MLDYSKEVAAPIVRESCPTGTRRQWRSPSPTPAPLSRCSQRLIPRGTDVLSRLAYPSDRQSTSTSHSTAPHDHVIVHARAPVGRDAAPEHHARGGKPDAPAPPDL